MSDGAIDPNRRDRLRYLFVALLAISFSSYQLYTAIFGALEPLIHRPIHLGFALGLVFLLYPARKRDSIKPFDVALAGLGMSLGLYLVLNYERLLLSIGRYETVDYLVGTVGVLVVLESCRRVVGLPLLVVSVGFILYAIFGDLFPGFLTHRGFSVERVVTRLFFTTEGILGIPLGASATYIFLFLLFGSLLRYTGVAAYFFLLATRLAGSRTGGAAKVAVVASGLFGSVSGSAIANVMGTGSFTIPMMKKLGYSAEFAGATEAAASTGGQLLPPVMGTAAFLVAEFLGLSYWTVVKAAIIPGLLYFTGIYVAVHFEAKHRGLTGLPSAELPSWSEVLGKIYLASPLVLVMVLLGLGASPTRSALYSMLGCLAVGFVNPSCAITLSGLVGVMREAAESALSVAVATASAGIIVGVVTLTGIGLKLGDGLISLAQGNLFLTLGFVALTALVLGMGVPTAPNYVITSMVAAPALLKLGVAPLAANMFVLYYGIVSDVTPPVCLSAFAAAAVAKSDPIKTGIQAFKNAAGVFWLLSSLY